MSRFVCSLMLVNGANVRVNAFVFASNIPSILFLSLYFFLSSSSSGKTDVRIAYIHHGILLALLKVSTKMRVLHNNAYGICIFTFFI